MYCYKDEIEQVYSKMIFHFIFQKKKKKKLAEGSLLKSKTNIRELLLIMHSPWPKCKSLPQRHAVVKTLSSLCVLLPLEICPYIGMATSRAWSGFYIEKSKPDPLATILAPELDSTRIDSSWLDDDTCCLEFLKSFFLWTLFGSMQFCSIMEAQVVGPLRPSICLGPGHAPVVDEYAINARHRVMCISKVVWLLHVTKLCDFISGNFISCSLCRLCCASCPPKCYIWEYQVTY